METFQLAEDLMTAEFNLSSNKKTRSSILSVIDLLVLFANKSRKESVVILFSGCFALRGQPLPNMCTFYHSATKIGAGT